MAGSGKASTPRTSRRRRRRCLIAWREDSASRSGLLHVNMFAITEGRAGMSDTLYARLGGYDAIVAVVDNLLPRLTSDPELGKFWKHRGEDGIRRERQLLMDFLCASASGPLYYVGRDMKTSHRGHRRTRLARLHRSSQCYPGQVPCSRRRTGSGARLHRKHEAGHCGIGDLLTSGTPPVPREVPERVGRAGL
jgi:hypothetical protein